jgi:hypothetical protein
LPGQRNPPVTIRTAHTHCNRLFKIAHFRLARCATPQPIALPDGGELRTLIDAGRYVAALPSSMHEREEWQTVMEVLLSAVEGREPVRLVHVALTLALQESKPTRRPRRKPAKKSDKR